MATAIFPENVAGVRLDAFARQALWQVGLDYDHGTGHGVGSYLSVHEGPISISPHLRPAVLAEGMIVSNEPGYYLPGSHGIRIENLVLVRPAETGGEKPFLRFEDLTLAPYDRVLIDAALLRPHERTWIDTYHARVLRAVGPQLSGAAASWLEQACAPL
jgi:Xaa-Pro aminopeptidase